jgi:hypothetical protein
MGHYCSFHLNIELHEPTWAALRIIVYYIYRVTANRTSCHFMLQQPHSIATHFSFESSQPPIVPYSIKKAWTVGSIYIIILKIIYSDLLHYYITNKFIVFKNISIVKAEIRIGNYCNYKIRLKLIISSCLILL